MSSDSPPDSWYEPAEDDDHECRGVWCIDQSHRDE
jgi:hypothetical protein